MFQFVLLLSQYTASVLLNLNVTFNTPFPYASLDFTLPEDLSLLLLAKKLLKSTRKPYNF